MKKVKKWLFAYARQPRVYEDHPPTNLEAVLAVVIVGGGMILLMAYLIF